MTPANTRPALHRPSQRSLVACTLGIALGLALAVVAAACAGPTMPPSAQSDSLGDPRRYEIAQLWGQIRDWRRDKGWAVEPAVSAKHPAVVNQSVDDLRICPGDPRPKEPVCQDTCELKDAICDNANSICRIAADLGEDAWAAAKCKDAKASCKEATTKCCACAARELETTSP